MKLAGAFTFALIASSSAHAADTVRCATDPQTRANFVSMQIISGLDAGGAVRSEGWMVRVIRDAEFYSDRLTEICAANPELALTSALGALVTPTVASVAPAR